MNQPLLVVDASVVAKWLLPEIDRETALRIQDQYQEEQVSLVAPRLLLVEVGHALWKRVRDGELEKGIAQECFDQLLVDAPLLVDSPEVALSAFRLSLIHRHPIYDCLYLALAMDCRCDLITADEQFYRLLQPTYSCIRLLRDFV